MIIVLRLLQNNYSNCYKVITNHRVTGITLKQKESNSYTKYFTNNTKIGYQKNFSLNNTPKFIQRDRNWSLKNNDLLKDYKVLGTFKDGHFFKKTVSIYTDLDTKIVI